MEEILAEEKEEVETGREDTVLARTGVSLPSNLLDKFDRIIRGRGYSSRSEGIRDAIRAYIVEYEWMESETGEEIGTITYIYETNLPGLRSELEEIECAFIETIKTSYSVHLDAGNCFALIVMKDKAKRIKKLTEAIMSRKGVKHLKLTTTNGVI